MKTKPQPESILTEALRITVGELHTTKRDNALDIAGYARCLAQIQGHE